MSTVGVKFILKKMPCALLAMAVYLARARGCVGLEASFCILPCLVLAVAMLPCCALFGARRKQNAARVPAEIPGFRRN